MPQRVPSRIRPATSLAVAWVFAGAVALAQVAQPQNPPAAPVATNTPVIDVTVLDRNGKPVDTLAPEDITVTVNGEPRRVVSVRRVSRGPGAVADVAARSLRPVAVGMTLAAEPVRTVLVVVDTATIVRRYEREARTTVSMLLDRLGIGDQVAVLSVPLGRDQLISFSSDQPAVRDAVARIVGQASRGTATADASSALADPLRAAGGDDRQRAGESERPAREDVAAGTGERTRVPGAADTEPVVGRDSAASLNQLMLALTKVPGRKTLILFSAGLRASASPQVTQAADRAARGRTVVHAFELRDDPGAQPEALDSGLADRLARATGGSYVALGGKPESQIERLVSELTATVVVGIERVDTDAPTRLRDVRLTTRRRDIVLRGPLAWSPDQPADNDVTPPPPAAPAPAAETGSLRYAAGGNVGVVPADAGPSAKDPKFLHAFGRLTDYVDSYVERSSALVAEEDYRQTFSKTYTSEKVHLRSDVLIVKPERSLVWVAFRDVFEVDDVKVRDREDRLKRIFLEAHSGADEQLGAIKAESARFNIGPVERNVNVPYFTLKFLSAANRGRFRYQMKGTPTVSGVKTWRIEFQEAVRPTIIRDRADADVPASGWFLVDQATGAIVQTGLTMESPGLRVSIVVRFARDPQLGLWVPDEMSETYRVAQPRRHYQAADVEDVVSGTAKYARFRRFQVNTETTLTIPK